MFINYTEKDLEKLYNFLGLTAQESELIEEIDKVKKIIRNYWVKIGNTDIDRCTQIVNNINFEYLTGSIDTDDKNVDNSEEYMYIKHQFQNLNTLISSIKSAPYWDYIDTAIMCNVLRKIAPKYISTIIGDFNVSFDDESDICFQNWVYRN